MCNLAQSCNQMCTSCRSITIIKTLIKPLGAPHQLHKAHLVPVHRQGPQSLQCSLHLILKQRVRFRRCASMYISMQSIKQQTRQQRGCTHREGWAWCRHVEG